ncbi:hypothetical protein JY486_11080 [Serratia marcescens]|uniref:hypothetical protein n=1 Tax=Serratia nevei TaxID=2703794 RepID=UPI0018D700F4|nr:hypothetical protein [Serratia marcescens]MBH2807090.1 hypothetical protein [Serratia marcescens]MBN5234715.1 hypothetical protein [Serratia marcescens]
MNREINIFNKKLLCVAALVLTLPIIAFIAKFHSLPFSEKTQDWSSFASYIGGVYGALFGFLTTITICATLYFTITFNQQQINQLRRQHHSALMNIYASNLNEKLDNKKYKIFSPDSGKNLNLDEKEFLDYAKKRYNLNYKISLSNNNREPHMLISGHKTIDELKLSYPNEIANLSMILELINTCPDKESREQLINQLHAITYPDRMFWVMIYAYFQVPKARECIAFNGELLVLAEGLQPKNP